MYTQICLRSIVDNTVHIILRLKLTFENLSKFLLDKDSNLCGFLLYILTGISFVSFTDCMYRDVFPDTPECHFRMNFVQTDLEK